MSETENYHLYIKDDSSTTFLDWRNAMNGTSDSNMLKIDTALSQKADNSIALSLTLRADQWVQEDAISYQEIAVEGLTETQNGVIGAAQLSQIPTDPL